MTYDDVRYICPSYAGSTQCANLSKVPIVCGALCVASACGEPLQVQDYLTIYKDGDIRLITF